MEAGAVALRRLFVPRDDAPPGLQLVDQPPDGAPLLVQVSVRGPGTFLSTGDELRAVGSLAVRRRVMRVRDAQVMRVPLTPAGRHNHIFRMTGDWAGAEDVMSLTFLEVRRLREKGDPAGGTTDRDNTHANPHRATHRRRNGMSTHPKDDVQVLRQLADVPADRPLPAGRFPHRADHLTAAGVFLTTTGSHPSDTASGGAPGGSP